MLLLTISDDSTNIRQFESQTTALDYMRSLYPDAQAIARRNNIHIFESDEKHTIIELINSPLLSLDTLVPDGRLDTAIVLDPEYPGLDIEYIPDNALDYPCDTTLPRILIEKPIATKELAAVVWTDCDREDYSCKITFNNPQKQH